ncbi:hypothetical protein V1514DRAFT_282796 [Lipomyces japonicus]|uniref:uncharacterized protein n=1 Tax=Lipomyces japonicus TaxID=56871 RepID=UPI0034CE60A4
MSSNLRRSTNNGQRQRKPVKSSITDHQAYQYSIRICYLTYLTSPALATVVPAAIKSELLPSSFLRFVRKSIFQYPYRNIHNTATVQTAFLNFSHQVTIKDTKDLLKSDLQLGTLLEIFTSCAKTSHNSHLSPDSLDACLSAFVQYLEFCLTKSKDKNPKLKSVIHSLVKIYPSKPKQVEIPFVALVANIFSLSNDMVRQDVLDLTSQLTQRDYVADLKKLSTSIVTNPEIATQFVSEHDYKIWREREIDAINQLILSMVMQSASLASTSSGRDSLIADDSIPFKFLPDNPTMYYRHILRLCLERDAPLAERVIMDDLDLADPLSSNFIHILSTDSRDFLSTLYIRWRVRRAAREIFLLELGKEMFVSDKISLSTLATVFKLIHAAQQVSKSENKEPWTREDKMTYSNSLKAIYSHLLRTLYEQMTLIFDMRSPMITPLIASIEKYLYSDELFQTTPADFQDYIVQIKDAVKKVAQSKFFSELGLVPRDGAPGSDPLVLLTVIKKTLNLISRISKRYTLPDSIGEISISRWGAHLKINIWVGEQLSSLAATYTREIFQDIKADLQKNAVDMAIEDISELYMKICELRSVYQKYSDSLFLFDVELELFPFIMVWLDARQGMSTTWVDANLKDEKFKPISDDQKHSISATDLFSSFHQQISVVRNLQWQNDYHNAKLYTVLMKGISASVRLYLQRLQESFAREMVTDNDVTAQPKRENWLAAARNITAKKKFEPHNFARESCVKLNNVEYIKNKLDALEASLDAETQAAIVRSMEPKPAKQKQSTSYIFSIDVVEAEGIKACDTNGFSDPYVELIDHQKKKRIAKTRTIQKDLNPRWNENFEYSVYEKCLIVARVWDEDLFGTHDECGNCSFWLNPADYEDFVSKDEWHYLRPQGRLRTIINVEGDRDDIIFYFGKAFKDIKRVEDFMVQSITDQLHAAIREVLSADNLKSVSNPSGALGTVKSFLGGSAAASESKKTVAEIEDFLDPIFDYLNANFATLAESLTETMRINVMMETWKLVVSTLDSLLLPSLSDKPTKQKPLTSNEVSIIFIWLNTLKDFFHHDGYGPSIQSLETVVGYKDMEQAKKYYDFSTEEIQRIYDSMSLANFERLQARESSIAQLMTRAKTIMAHKNLGTMKAQKEKILEARRDVDTEDVLLRILRLRGQDKLLTRIFDQRKKFTEQLTTKAKLREMKRGFNRKLNTPTYKSK